jgi:hypothetical protein
VSVSAQRDPAVAAQFPQPAAPAPPPAPAADKPAADSAAPAETPKSEARTVERLAARTAGVEFEIPVYKYESLFKPQEELLEKK